MQPDSKPLGWFTPYEENPRIHSEEAITEMARLIKAHTFLVPVIASPEGELIDGHLRLKAAKKLKLKSIPVVYTNEKDPAKLDAMRISVNKASELADWDQDILPLLFGRMDEAGLDLRLSGFDFDLKTFAPVVDPKVDLRKITDEDMTTAQENSGHMAMPPQSVTILCPHCGVDFEVDKI